MEGHFNYIPPQKPEEDSKKGLSEQPQLSEIDSIKPSNPDDWQSVVPKDIEALTVKLEDYFYDQSDPSLQKNKETYLENINNNEELVELIAEYPDNFDHLFYIIGEKTLNKKEIESLAFNFKERQVETSKNKKDMRDRIIYKPEATDEEYRLGTYGQSIESQVRGAVFALQEKGYFPMESGFLDLVEGSQYIGLDNGENVDTEAIVDSIVNPVDQAIKRLFKLALKTISVDFLDKDNIIQIILVPENKNMSLEDWKMIWHYIAQCIPDIKGQQNKKEIDNGLQGVRFRETQDRIKEGKNAWLGSGLAFLDGKIVSMPHQDFVNLEKSPK